MGELEPHDMDTGPFILIMAVVFALITGLFFLTGGTKPSGENLPQKMEERVK